MKEINVLTYEPNEILVKEAFKRAIPADDCTPLMRDMPRGNSMSKYNAAKDNMRFVLFSQSDFLREYYVDSHKINSIVYYPNPLMKDEDNKVYAKVQTRVAVGFQERIHNKRLTALIGNNANIKITKAKPDAHDQEMLSIFREGWEEKNMEVAISQAISADGKVGDAAISFFLSNGEFGWRLLSFEKGDTLYPHFDPVTGKLALFGRRYGSILEGGKQIEFLDVWDNTYYARYKMEDGEGGWVVDQPAKRHGFNEVPIAYDRYGEPFWANSQSLIDNFELSMSQLAENNRAYALRILYSFGEEMSMNASMDGTPVSIESSDPNAKVGFLEPADSSNSFRLQLETIEKNIMRCSHAVETPEIKSGADMSSLTVKMLFADAYLKALQDSVHFQPFLDKVVELFKYGYGIESMMSSDFRTMKVKAELYPYIFQSESETVNAIVQLKGIGALSRKSSTEIAYELGYGVVGENSRILQEEHDALAGTTETTTVVEETKDVNVVSNARNEA